MRVLIVDDNVAMRKVLSALVVSAGHEVVAALEDGNGLEGRVTELQPDVVCLDYALPGRDGLALVAAVHQVRPQADVLFITASSDPGVEQKAADVGVSGFLRKPFGQQQIIDELRVVEETRRKAQCGSQAAEQPAVGEKAMATWHEDSVVIADDNGSVRLLLKGLVEESGMRVVQCVANGAEAVQAARTFRPKLMFLDVEMPVMSGLEALPKIREASPQTSVVMVTACSDKGFVAKAAGAGAIGYILKPLRPAYIESFMQRWLGQKAAGAA